MPEAPSFFKSSASSLRALRYRFLGLTLLSLIGLCVYSVSTTAGMVPIQQTAAASSFGAITLEAAAAVVYDLQRDEIIFDKNADAQLPLASLTKIPLVLVTSEVLGPHDMITISRDAVARGEGGLTSGEVWRVKDLIDYTLVQSSNVGAEALSEAASERLTQKYPDAPSGDGTVWRMNELARSLDLSRTYFLSPTGLDIGINQAGALGSARDVAKLYSYVYGYASPLFFATTQPGGTLGPQQMGERPVTNTNDALPYIPGLVFGKTGFTDLAGGNVAVLYEIGPDRPIIIVVLGSTESGRFRDLRTLIGAANRLVTSQ